MKKIAVSFIALIGMAGAALAQPAALTDQQLDAVSAGWFSSFTFQNNYNNTHQTAVAVSGGSLNVAVIPVLSAVAQGNTSASNSNQTIQVNHN